MDFLDTCKKFGGVELKKKKKEMKVPCGHHTT